MKAVRIEWVPPQMRFQKEIGRSLHRGKKKEWVHHCQNGNRLALYVIVRTTLLTSHESSADPNTGQLAVVFQRPARRSGARTRHQSDPTARATEATVEAMADKSSDLIDAVRALHATIVTSELRQPGGFTIGAIRPRLFNAASGQRSPAGTPRLSWSRRGRKAALPPRPRSVHTAGRSNGLQ